MAFLYPPTESSGRPSEILGVPSLVQVVLPLKQEIQNHIRGLRLFPFRRTIAPEADRHLPTGTERIKPVHPFFFYCGGPSRTSPAAITPLSLSPENLVGIVRCPLLRPGVWPEYCSSLGTTFPFSLFSLVKLVACALCEPSGPVVFLKGFVSVPQHLLWRSGFAFSGGVD